VEAPRAFRELTTNNFPQVDGWKTAEPKDNALRGKWWEVFNDSKLNELEEEANVSNQSVALSLANFLAARSVVKQARSQLFPVVTTSPSITRAKLASPQNQSGSTTANSTFTEYSLPVDASWELDLWGRIRNTVKANSFEAQAALADLENVRLTVKAELASDYFQIRALDAQKQLLDSAVLAYRESFNLTRIRYDTGIASDQDVAQAETQLNTTAAQSTDIGIQRAQLEHAIALLVGKPASSFSIAAEPLTAKPQAIPLDVPSHLLERRPDIAAAERRVAELNAQIGVAKAAYFPALTLSGAVGYQNSSLANLVTWPSFAWSVGASLAETLFDAGRRKAVTEQFKANYQGTVASYRQTVLTAFQEVEDNLSTLRLLSQELQEEDAAVKSSQRYLTLANDRYKLGIDSYLNVITAQTTLLVNQRTAVNLRSQQMTATVQLIKALGGGWDSTLIPASRQITSLPSVPPAKLTP
ncbi:MAG: efflux system, outer rane lipoprotein NodT, partial [Verrucomicrobiales bacterium]|nr:efflux system, outer rane lipoprotein NodT [Verrucomicrobiales bacterium]